MDAMLSESKKRRNSHKKKAATKTQFAQYKGAGGYEKKNNMGKQIAGKYIAKRNKLLKYS